MKATKVAEYEEVVVGHIPSWRYASRPEVCNQEVRVKTPKLDHDGVPIIKIIEKKVKGRGKPDFYLKEKREVVIPELADPTYKIRRVLNKGYVVERGGRLIMTLPKLMSLEEIANTPKGDDLIHYSPNIFERPTGTFEEINDVSFEVNFDPNTVSIKWAIAGTIIGLAIFHLKPFLVNKE